MPAHDVETLSASVRVFPSLPLLNFLALLVLAAQRGSPDLFRQLSQKYASAGLRETGWGEALEAIAETYFGIARPRQSNPLFDMMGSLFGGGGGGGAAQPPRRTGLGSSGGLGSRGVEAPPAEGLD